MPPLPDSSSDLDDDPLSSVPASPVSARPSPPVESLVAGRARRSNAGNLLAKLLTQEADEEDTLFLEDEDDVEFEAKEEEDNDDALMEDSDSDVEDAGPPAEGEEEVLEGEKEIEAAEKEAKKAKKRKADDIFLKPPPKKVTIAPSTTAEGTAGERQRKKSERISWVPEFVATRASSRTLSLQNRSETMRRLEESEKRRLHTIALMERAAAKKAKVRPKKEMTQEERLEEAKITERKNRRSLFSWEETEKAKLEEQRQKLLALQNRKLAGPVITYWSGAAEWNADSGRLVKVGRGLIEEVVKPPVLKKVKKKKDKEGEKAEDKEGDKEEDTIRVKDPATAQNSTATPAAPDTAPAAPTQDSTTSTSAPTATPVFQEEKKDLPAFLDGILDYAVPAPPQQPLSDQPAQLLPQQPSGAVPQPLEQPVVPIVPPTSPPKPNEVSARNVIVLENFDLNLVRDKASLTKALLGNQTKPLPVAKPYCPITQQPAKFRDPATGMPLANLHAYREMRRLLRGEIRWSHLLGAYMGEAGDAASGVPEGF
ncbi:YL1 nuclear protein-domain-containing protein [Sphaerosporella brunnea]|uniref:YL1 nuclear protein-domain-containing protein n=1 Tax=Sphaerosporella brunnea TaxID=1250544 RepID=A0A5J5F552_9PEZI|nr:YL1 nuclear protein-domain-containing protein [Sphaerosporella brunnea]